MGGCQNYGPFLGTLNLRCRMKIRTQKGTLILTTTHIGAFIIRIGSWHYTITIGRNPPPKKKKIVYVTNYLGPDITCERWLQPFRIEVFAAC